MTAAIISRPTNDLMIVSRIDESGCPVAISPQQERFNAQVSDMIDQDLVRLREVALVRRANREAAASVLAHPAIAAALVAGISPAKIISHTLGRTRDKLSAKAA